MNKKELIAGMAQALDSKETARLAVDALFETIGDALKNQDRVTLPGFGSFRVENRPARIGRNPRTGEAMHIPARKTPRFIPAKALKDEMID